MSVAPVICVLCQAEGDPDEVMGISRPGTTLPDGRFVCSPCRAERTGSVRLRLFRPFVPPDVVTRLEGPKPQDLLEALGDWATALLESSRAIADLRQLLMGASDEEAVADVLMGTAGAVSLSRGEGRHLSEFTLENLSPVTARRLAETTCADAEGPPLTPQELERVATELRGRS